MNPDTIRADADRAPTSATRTRRTHVLLAGGAAAGPLFVSLVTVQALTREGFDLAHQPLSLLSLGALGWVQVTNFVVTGLLVLGLAAAMRQTLRTGAGRTWAPVLTALFGIGLVAGGVFLPDPALGYPPGTPDAVPDTLSWHAILHAVAPPVAFTALVACCLVLARRFAGDGRPGMAVYSTATGLTALVLSAWPSQDGASVRLAVAVLVGFAWTTLVAVRLRSTD